ncbi:MAG: hypothetical protein WC401_02440 [Bacteroidales bacterium]|nr:hypothetical protein [Bacteroidales bacterium]
MARTNDKAKSNIRLLLYSLLTSFILVELILRLWGGMYTPIEKLAYFDGKYHSMFTAPKSWLNLYEPNSTHRFASPNEFEYYFKSNSDGLAEKNDFKEKAEREYRIVGIGDSYTEGIGTDQDSTWLKLVERNIRLLTGNVNVFTINGGIAGSDPFYEYIIFDKLLLKHKPSLLLCAINISDLGDVAFRGGFERFQNDGTVKFTDGPQWEWLYGYCHIIRLFVHKVLNYNLQFLSPSQQKDKEIKAIQDIKNVILKYQKLALLNNFQMVVILHPWKHEVETGKSFFIEEISGFCENNNIQYLDLLHYYKSVEKIRASNSNDYFWTVDDHNKPKGYQAFARGVIQKLNEMGIIDSLKK